MRHEEKKVAKILDELTMFFFSIGANKMEAGIEMYEESAKIRFSSNYLPEYEHSIHTLEKCLDEPRNEAMEDIYWELTGSGDPGESSQLMLVGMMIEKYEIEKTENEIKLVLYKDF